MPRLGTSRSVAVLATVALVACGGGSTRPTTPPSVDGPAGALAASRPHCHDMPTRAPSDAARARVDSYVALLHTLHPDMDWEAVNHDLDAGYQGLLALEADGRAAVRERVLAEARAPSPNHFELLDLGHFVISEDCADVRAATTAFLALDPNDPLVVVGSRDLFEMAHALAMRGDPAIVPTLDRMITSDRPVVFIPDHAMEIDPALQGVFLYGALSPDAATHVAARLADDEANRDLLIDILGWIGSPENVPAIAAVARVDGDADTVRRIVGAMMRIGGPAGRQAVLDLPREHLSPESISYLDAIRDSVEAEGFPNRAALSEVTRVPGDEMRRRLEHMIAVDGHDDTVDPSSLLVSDLSNAELIAYLRALRVAMLRRVSDEALDDVQVANALIHLLSFRTEPAQ